MNQIITITIVLTVFCLVTIAIIIFYFSKKFRDLEEGSRGDQGLNFLNQNIQALQQTLNDRLDNASRVMMAVNSELGQMKEIGSNLKNIQEFLRSPKLRGNLGEQGLKELLSGALPAKYFDMQYGFRSGVIVDAVIHLDAGKICIDSKFPFENFNAMLKSNIDEDKQYYRRKFREDFRRHVQAISKKYVDPDEGTTDFAFMYIPSESIYFEIINNEQDLFEYAANEHVIISSPSTFFYYLRTIMLGLEGKRITEMSREILKTLKTIKRESGMMGEYLGVLGRHINNANKTMSAVSDQYLKMQDRIDRVGVLEENQSKLIGSSYETEINE